MVTKLELKDVTIADERQYLADLDAMLSDYESMNYSETLSHFQEIMNRAANITAKHTTKIH
ncbi:MAG: hypothetical protein ACK502_00745 [Alphaproteobacteria bacterium]